MKFVANKCIKQIGLLGRETRRPPTGTRRYLLGLSLGVSSAVLVHLLNENVEFQLARGRNAPFELVVVHIDTSALSSRDSDGQKPSPAAAALERYRERYPRFTFHCVPLSSVLDGPQISAAILNHDPASPPASQPPSTPPPTTASTAAPNLETLLASLPSAASRTDILGLLTRRALLAQARARDCQALLLGHSTTALAELTLAEAAKGRGFALPWLVHDGPALPVKEGGEEGAEGTEPVLVHHPLRDALRKELATYAELAGLAVTVDRGAGEGKTAARVVSHRDLSIEEVMVRYFAEVEESYPSVVANVARTTGKLVRVGGEGQGQGRGERCGLCTMPLDEAGDERWRGELGLGTPTRTGPGAVKLCYGCERSTVG